MLYKLGFGCNIITAISKQLVTLVGFAYVDDCGLIQTGTDPITGLSSINARTNKQLGQFDGDY